MFAASTPQNGNLFLCAPLAGIGIRGDAEWDGINPDEVDPTFEEEFAEFRTRWPRFYTQDTPDRT